MKMIKKQNQNNYDLIFCKKTACLIIVFNKSELIQTTQRIDK
jgi:hypothetical protein